MPDTDLVQEGLRVGYSADILLSNVEIGPVPQVPLRWDKNGSGCVEIGESVRRITNDLRAIESEMTQIAQLGVSSPECAAMVDELLTEDLVHEFKAAVDHMRHFLWSYIEAVADGKGNDMDSALQMYRIRRVTEMLRVLEGPLGRAEGILRQQPETTTFIEEIIRIASMAVAKAPAASD